MARSGPRSVGAEAEADSQQPVGPGGSCAQSRPRSHLQPASARERQEAPEHRGAAPTPASGQRGSSPQSGDRREKRAPKAPRSSGSDLRRTRGETAPRGGRRVSSGGRRSSIRGIGAGTLSAALGVRGISPRGVGEGQGCCTPIGGRFGEGPRHPSWRRPPAPLQMSAVRPLRAVWRPAAGHEYHSHS